MTGGQSGYGSQGYGNYNQNFGGSNMGTFEGNRGFGGSEYGGRNEAW